MLHVGTLTPRDVHRRADAELLQLAADRAATSIERARLFHQRGVVEALQRSLVPERLPIVPGLALAARYRPAVRRGGIGGDWYDAFALGARRRRARRRRRDGPRHRRGGDDGADAHRPARLRARRPFAGGRRRAAQPARAHARRAPDDDAGLRRARPRARTDDDRQRGSPPAAAAPRRRRRRPCSTVDGDAPLGRLVAQQATASTSSTCPPAARSCWSPTARSRSAARASSTASSGCARWSPASPTSRVMCEAVARGDARGRPADDDVAVLAARLEPLPDALRTTLAGDARRRWRRCARCCAAGSRAGAPADDEIYDITVAVQEASANAVEHAYAPGDGHVRGRGRACDDGVITFVDPRPRALARAARDASRARNRDDAGADGGGRRDPRRRAAPWSCCGGRWGGGRHEPARARATWSGTARRRSPPIDGEVDASNVAEVGVALRGLVTNQSAGAGRRPVADRLPGQRRHQPDVRARRRAALAPAHAAARDRAEAPRSRGCWRSPASTASTRPTRRSPRPSARSRRASGRRRP